MVVEDLALLAEHTSNPFPGLRPFETNEGHLFFGREGQSEELLRRLRQSRLLALVGSSGSGKSSLVRAGLVPYLYGGWLANAGAQWRVAMFRPGENPIRRLAQELSAPDVIGRANPSEEEAARDLTLTEVRLRRSGLGLVEVVSLARLPDGQNLLVVIDQFEELFRFAGASGESGDDAAFVKLILEATRQAEEPIYVVLTMRSDFIGDCSQFRDLPEAVAAGLYLIPRMTRDQQRAAIEEPVRVAGGSISRRVANRLLNDAGDDPDQLPIMQHALMRAWDHWKAGPRNDRPIDLEDYNAIGGMVEALSKHADEAYGDLDDKGQTIAQRMFQSLTEKGVDNREVRRAMRVGAIAKVVGVPVSEVIPVIEEFRKPGRSFLMPSWDVPLDDDTLIDISHESLIRQWKRLADWVEEESERAKSYRRLAETAVLYEKGKADLWGDNDLAAYQAWIEPTTPWAERYHADFEAAKSFLAASRRAREAELSRKRKFRQKVSGITAIVMVGLIALTVVAFHAKNIANEARKRADQVTELAIDRAATLGKSVAASGSQIQEAMQKADAMLWDVLNAHGTDPKTAIQAASLFLSSASASQTLGAYKQQRQRIAEAQKLLDPICGEERGSDPGCRKLLAETFEVEGDYLRLDAEPKQPQDAILAYRHAIDLRKQIEASGTAEPDISLALARTEASLSLALSSAGESDDALKAVQNCRDAAGKAGSDGEEVKTVHAHCDLAEAEAQLRLAWGPYQSLELVGLSVDKAETAFAAFGELAKTGSTNDKYLSYVVQGGRAAHVAFEALWWATRKDDAIAWLEKAEKSLADVVRKNPQNNQLAELLSSILDKEAQAYHKNGRDDLSAGALEEQRRIADARRDGTRSAHWQGVQVQSRGELANRYSALERHPEALQAIEEMLAVKKLINAEDNSDAWDILRAGLAAHYTKNDVKAFEYFQSALEQSERQLDRLRAEGHDATAEVKFNEIVHAAITSESEILSDWLSTDRRLDILTSIAENTSRYARSEPRIIPFKLAQGRSLFQLALAKEFAGDAVGAREVHQAASDAGWRASTNVLKHLYFEGGAGLSPDLKRARELEALAQQQSDLPRHSEEVEYQSGGKGQKILYFPAPTGDGDPMADEYYRLMRYYGARVTEVAKHEIEAIYSQAKETNRNIFDIINDLKNRNITVDEIRTPVYAVLAFARKQLTAEDFAGAIQTVTNSLDWLQESDKDHDHSYLVAWDQLARVALDIEAAAKTANQGDVVLRAQSIAATATVNIGAVHADGSIPKLRVAADLEKMAWQEEVEATHLEYAVSLLGRAIEFREQVRTNEPKNAQCHCQVAADYNSIGRIQESRKKFDEAMIAFGRAVMIYEDLAHLSPDPQWDKSLVSSYESLAGLFGKKRKELASALFYAEKAAGIRKAYAERQSADLPTRIQYATSLENVSDYAWDLAKTIKADDPKTADTYFQLAIASRMAANAKRQAVFAHDPENVAHSALANNARVLAKIYLSWGRPDDARALVDGNVEVARQATSGVFSNASEYERQYHLAVALMQRAYALETFKDKDYQSILRDLNQSASLLRPIFKDLPAAADTLRSVLLSISFEALFVRNNQQALEAADEGLKIVPHNLRLMANKAHALMFLARTDEARQLYLQNIGKEFGHATWEYYVTDDFKQLKTAGITSRLMDEVLEAFGARAKRATRN
jgi:hypothetical protein